MDTPDVFSAIFAGLAFVIAFFAAFDARDSRKASERSADSAEHANDINLHESRLEIYKGFQVFHGALVQRGVTIQEGDVWPFLNKANLSQFYFDENVYKRLTAIANAALTIVSGAEDLEFTRQLSTINRATTTNMRAVLNQKHKNLRAECVEADEALRAELRLYVRR